MTTTFVISPNRIRNGNLAIYTLEEILSGQTGQFMGATHFTDPTSQCHTTQADCTWCDGTGTDDDGDTCPDCEGNGTITEHEGCEHCIDLVAELDDPNAYTTTDRNDVKEAIANEAKQYRSLHLSTGAYEAFNWDIDIYVP